ncbi:DNA mismatch repair protein MutS [cyanobiont of Ornithocercus magnificus]|nr:DNA mismatch repair protein MutS [cyanobiont of Ornithocercus magnificus]
MLLDPSIKPSCTLQPLLQRGVPLASQRALHIIVHGRQGGEIPNLLLRLAESVSRQRSAAVVLESLTQDAPSLDIGGDLWVVPLFLLPGSHTRVDVPGISQRLERPGRTVRRLPFLGAWPVWLDMLEDWIRRQMQLEQPTTALLHHPLRPGVADRYLRMLQHRLPLPLLPFDQWQCKRWPPRSSRRLLPLALAPNKMSDAIEQASRAPVLLECPQICRGLVQLLASLP